MFRATGRSRKNDYVNQQDRDGLASFRLWKRVNFPRWLRWFLTFQINMLGASDGLK